MFIWVRLILKLHWPIQINIFIWQFYCTTKYIVQISINKRWTAIEKWKCVDSQNVISVFSGPRAQMVCKSSPFLKCIPVPRKLTPCTQKISSSIPILSFSFWLQGTRLLTVWMVWWIDEFWDLLISLLLCKTSNFVLTSTIWFQDFMLESFTLGRRFPCKLSYINSKSVFQWHILMWLFWKPLNAI